MSNNGNFLDGFILVECNGLPYPEGYTAHFREVAAHFEISTLNLIP